MTTLSIECYKGVLYKQGSTIPVPYGYLGMKTITIGTSTAQVALFTGTNIVSMTTDETVTVFYNMGSGSATAALTDRPIKVNERLDRSVEENNYIACIKA